MWNEDENYGYYSCNLKIQKVIQKLVQNFMIEED